MEAKKQKKRTGLWILLGLFGLLAAALIVSALTNLTLPKETVNPQTLSDLDKARLSEIERVRTSLGDEIMPGWGSEDIPNITFNDSYAFLTGMSNPAEGWVKVPQEIMRGQAWQAVPQEYWDGTVYYRQALEGDKTPECFAVRVGEQYAGSCQTFDYMRISMIEMVRGDLPGFLKPVFPYKLMVDAFVPSSEIYMSMMLHENFHAYQAIFAPERFKKAEFANLQLADSYPWEDEPGVENWQMELDALISALESESENEAVNWTLQFLTYRAERRNIMQLSGPLVQYEREREWMEGLARYAELEVLRRAASPDYEPVAEMQQDPAFKDYRKFEQRWSRELDQMARMATDEGDGRFYYTGMAQAYLLDRFMPDWKVKLQADPQLNLEDLLTEAVAGR